MVYKSSAVPPFWHFRNHNPSAHIPIPLSPYAREILSPALQSPFPDLSAVNFPLLSLLLRLKYAVTPTILNAHLFVT